MSRSISITRAVGVALVQDGGRPHRLRAAIPRGGALDLESLARANLASGNEASAAAIERYGPIELVANEDVVLADERGSITVLGAGAGVRFDWDGSRRVGYVAIDGGIDVPQFFGGRGTMLSIARGGHEGRTLRRGDVLSLGVPGARGERRAITSGDGPISAGVPRSPGRHDHLASAPRTIPVEIRVTLGPDLDRLVPDAAEQLLSHAWALDVRSDRMGTRLRGPTIPHREGSRAITTPMIEGAIECPPDGAPIVLGPDHPTTGGYPVVAVVIEADLARFHRVALGRDVRFARA